MVFIKYEKLLRKQAKKEWKIKQRELKNNPAPTGKQTSAQKQSGDKKVHRPEYLIPGGMNQ